MIPAILIAILILAAWRYPTSAFGHLVADRLTRPLARWLDTVDRRRVIFVVLVLIMLLTAGEIIAAMGPLDMSMVLLWDVSSFLDAALATAALASVARVGTMARGARAVIYRVRPRRGGIGRRRRAPRGQRRTPPANDSDGRPVPAIAA